MNNYLEKVSEIKSILQKVHEDVFIKQIENAKLMGGTGGEILAIICSLLKTHEIQNPVLFNLIREPAEELYEYAESLGMRPSANFHLLDELSE